MQLTQVRNQRILQSAIGFDGVSVVNAFLPTLTAWVVDPTSYNAPSVDGLQGEDEIVARYKLVQQKDAFESTFGFEKIDADGNYHLRYEEAGTDAVRDALIEASKHRDTPITFAELCNGITLPTCYIQADLDETQEVISEEQEEQYPVDTKWKPFMVSGWVFDGTAFVRSAK